MKYASRLKSFRLKGGGDEETKRETPQRQINPRIRDLENNINTLKRDWDNTRERIIENRDIDEESRAELRELVEETDQFLEMIRDGNYSDNEKEYFSNLTVALRISIHRFLSGIEQM